MHINQQKYYMAGSIIHSTIETFLGVRDTVIGGIAQAVQNRQVKKMQERQRRSQEIATTNAHEKYLADNPDAQTLKQAVKEQEAATTIEEPATLEFSPGEEAGSGMLTIKFKKTILIEPAGKNTMDGRNERRRIVTSHASWLNKALKDDLESLLPPGVKAVFSTKTDQTGIHFLELPEKKKEGLMDTQVILRLSGKGVNACDPGNIMKIMAKAGSMQFYSNGEKRENSYAGQGKHGEQQADQIVKMEKTQYNKPTLAIGIGLFILISPIYAFFAAVDRLSELLDTREQDLLSEAAVKEVEARNKYNSLQANGAPKGVLVKGPGVSDDMPPPPMVSGKSMGPSVPPPPYTTKSSAASPPPYTRHPQPTPTAPPAEPTTTEHHHRTKTKKILERGPKRQSPTHHRSRGYIDRESDTASEQSFTDRISMASSGSGMSISGDDGDE